MFEPVNKKPVPPIGPKNAKIVIVGEAPARAEVDKMIPFQGGAGKELNSWLEHAGLRREDIYITNVLPWRSPRNKIVDFCVKKREAEEAYQEYLPGLREQYPDFPWPEKYTWKHIGQAGAYLHPKYLYRLPELRDEILRVNPNLVIPMGNAACWGTIGQTGISKIRGTVAWTENPEGYKALPITHPAAVLRNYSDRPICLLHMQKAEKESHEPGFYRPGRHILIDPTLEEIEDFYHTYFKKAKYCGLDIETIPHRQIITMVGFSADETHAVVVPFADSRQPDGSYWTTPETERQAWEWVKTFCQKAAVEKVLQNGLYDLFWLWEQFGITTRGNVHDTLILSRSLQPELPADLGTQGSMFTNEPAWKLMRKKKSAKELE